MFNPRNAKGISVTFAQKHLKGPSCPQSPKTLQDSALPVGRRGGLFSWKELCLHILAECVWKVVSVRCQFPVLFRFSFIVRTLRAVDFTFVISK